MIKHWFTPQLIKKFPDSKYNQNIKLIKFGGKLRLDIGGLTQSGQIMEWIWNKAFKNLLPKGFNPFEILILGFGTGSSAKLINKKWPQAKIIGIEIDSQVIEIGKKYFQTTQIKNLKIINTDAIKYIEDHSSDGDPKGLLRGGSSYNLILLDCYQGDQIPVKFEDIKFLKKLKSQTNHLFLNRLYWEPYKTQTNKFLNKLKKHFDITTCRTPSNLVVSLS